MKSPGMKNSAVAAANCLGVGALLLWSMNIAVTRHIGEAHPYGMPGVSFLLAGAIVVLFDFLVKKPAPWTASCTASKWFWIAGGGAFVAYLLLYVSGLSFSASRTAVLSLGLINYFWPSLILALMPFFFSCRVRLAALLPGIFLCLAGVGCSLLWGLRVPDIMAMARELWPACLMMALAAFLWAFYSNAARKWGGNANGVGWFMLAGGLCFFALWFVRGGELGMRDGMLLPLLIHAVAVNAAAYMLWDAGVRRGDIGLMGTLANFLPMGSIVFGAWYLGDAATIGVWIGGALVTLGAVLCRRGMAE